MRGTRALRYRRYAEGSWQAVDGAVVEETPVRIHVNGRELVTLMCTPIHQDLLAAGFLRGEGIIGGMDDIRLLKVCPSGACVEVWLRRADFEPPTGRTLTTGCGGGVTFADIAAATEPVNSDIKVAPDQLCRLMGALQAEGKLYQEARGLHTAGLATGEALLAVAEDVGRHNTIDKVWGRCLVERIPTQGCILLSTGRISSEMLYKAARMGVPIVASRTSPTSLSIELAQSWRITLVGYVRRDSFNVYTGRERIIDHEPQPPNAPVAPVGRLNEEEQKHANS